MNTDKRHIQNLASICYQKGVRYAVISPGSRCAPLIVAFNRKEGIECISIIDERSAGFVALGIAQQTGQTVALICTSGSAVLNYAPALSEAFYQRIPLLVLSADRPNEWIDQGENQSINQFEVYKNYIKKSYQLPLQINTEKDLWYSDRMISEALNTCIHPDFGPVHINIPLREPLYNLVEDHPEKPKIIEFEQPKYTLDKNSFKILGKSFQEQEKILIVAGGLKHRSKELSNLLQQFSNQDNIVILKESIANVYGENFIDQIDANIEVIQANDLVGYEPNLVITFGGGVVSKKLKFWLRNLENVKHWHVTKSFEHWDIFQSLSKVIQVDALSFFHEMKPYLSNKPSSFRSKWTSLALSCYEALNSYLDKETLNDFTFFKFLMNAIPENSNIQLGNSTPVRYANLLPCVNQVNVSYNSNRGVSGIDGVISTAAGASIVQKNTKVICICGDIATLYDSNGLLNYSLSPNFKLIVINNNGGNIFKIIPGPSKLDEAETYFQTKHKVAFKDLATTYGFSYYNLDHFAEMEEVFSKFINESDSPALLEVRTDGEQSARFLRNYFEYLKVKFKPV